MKTLPKEPRSERRASVRFPLTLDVRYSVSHRRAPVEAGSGQIIDLSSSGLRFAAQGPLEPGLKLDVAIDWPVLLDGRVQLQLIVTGVVVWSSGTETALQIQQHDFRTRSVRLCSTTSCGNRDVEPFPGARSVRELPSIRVPKGVRWSCATPAPRRSARMTHFCSDRVTHRRHPRVRP